MTRYFAWATDAAGAAFALVAILLFTTTTGYGCEDGCGPYEYVLMWTGPILFGGLVNVHVGRVTLTAPQQR